MHAWKAHGRSLAIVSNNSIHAIEAYLDMHHLRSVVDIISARVDPDTSLLKPSPYLVTKAAKGSFHGTGKLCNDRRFGNRHSCLKGSKYARHRIRE